MPKKKVLVFGASGNLGAVCLAELASSGYEALPVGRDLSILKNAERFHGAVWAQGHNVTESFINTSDDEWTTMFEANFLYIVKTLGILLRSNSLDRGSRLVVISSVWQEIARPEKVAYIASKAAVGGLVRGLAADLGSEGIAINAVLPGIVDSPMTKLNLSHEQVAAIEATTPGGRLVGSLEIAKVVAFLISKESEGINGQSIVVDGGWSITRNV